MKRKEILEKAIECVCGSREQDYGSPENSFSAIADYWQLYVNHNCIDEFGKVFINSKDVAVMMCLFKIARIETGHGKEDNWIDLAGYAANGGEIEAKENGICHDVSCICKGCRYEVLRALVPELSKVCFDYCRVDCNNSVDSYESI